MVKSHTEAQDFVKKMLDIMGFSYESIETIQDEDSGLMTIYVKTNEGRTLIGKDGEVLNALSSILHRYLEQGVKEDESPIQIGLDVNDFQKKHIESIKTKAHMMAERAKFFKSSIELEPMNGYERRIVHTFLEKDKNITTESTGEGKNRRIVVIYKEE